MPIVETSARLITLDPNEIGSPSGGLSGNVSVTDPACQGARAGWLFNDHFWFVKLGLAIGLFALLCRRSKEEVADILPPAEVAVNDSAELRGKMVHAWALRVAGVTEDGYDVETYAGPVHLVDSSSRPSAGDYVSFYARIAGPRRVVATFVRIEAGYFWKRGLNYGLSALTVLVFLWIVRRHFRWRLSEGLFRSRY